MRYLFPLCLLFAPEMRGQQKTGEDIPEKTVDFTASYLRKEGLLGLHFENYPGWHTYWKNPGDAGLPIEVSFSLQGQPLNLEALQWPIPQRFIEGGDIMAYGYSEDYSLFFRLPENFFQTDRGKTLSISASWLVCKHICIPGEKKLSLPVDPEFQAPHSVPDGDTLSNRLKALPESCPLPEYLELSLSANEKKNGFIFLYAVDGNRHLARDNLNILTPFPHPLFDFKHEKIMRDEAQTLYGQLPAGWDGPYVTPSVPFPSDGHFRPPEKASFLFNDPVAGHVCVIEKEFQFFDQDNFKETTAFFASLIPYDENQPAASRESSSSLLFYLLLALLGGIILNVMPCVLPVISIKLFSLIKHTGQSRARILKHNLLYTLGILTSFALLSTAIVILKSLGASVGWGIQLQSPPVIVVMVLVLLVFALNLFGLFEFRFPGGSRLGNLDLKEGSAGDFMSGVLATLLSTPCSAPFLGTALTFAFTSSPSIIFLVLSTVGLGLSLPFILIGLFPALVSFLPRPGPWMEQMKKFLGLALLLTIIWLLDIFNALVDTHLHTMKLYTLMALVFFAFYHRASISKKMRYNIFLFSLPALLTLDILFSDFSRIPTGATDLIREKKLPWEEWTVERMETYRRGGELVFIDFTAKWCFTCKVNEKLVLETEGFRNLSEEFGVKLLLADWTRRDPVIEKWLRSQGFVGVPAYFVIRDGEIVSLGETITLGEIRQALAGRGS